MDYVWKILAYGDLICISDAFKFKALYTEPKSPYKDPAIMCLIPITFSPESLHI